MNNITEHTAAASKVVNQIELELASDCAFYHQDPLGWVLWAFDWGHGDLEGFDGPDQWQKDWLIQWGEEIRKRKFDGVTPVPVVRMSTASGHGIGKAFRNNDLALTPTGIRRWGDLKPGDQLFDENGAPIRILQTHHYTNIPMYRVTFDDRSYADVSSGHLWNVRGRQERRKGIDTWRTMETIEILEQGVKRPNGTAQARQWEIPVQGSTQFEEREVDLHPYLVGVWLGDGSKGLPRYCKPFDEIADKIRSFGYEVTDCTDGKSKYIPNITHLMTEPVFQLGSHERYIPDDYKFNTVDNRMALFCGLCDTDGEVHKSGSIGYSTTSEKLANDMVWLARSLGCKAMIQPAIKNGWYPGNNGERVECRDCYRVSINAPFNPFTLKHRRAAYKPSESRYLKRWIESIEPVGYDNGMCVTVDSEAGLYLTDQFHVTHNSAMVAWIILFIKSTRPQSKGIVTANTGDQLRTKTWGELAVWKKRCITGHWFTLNSGKGSLSMYHKGWPETWRVDAMTCQKENSEAFAGLHSATSSPYYLFDESSNVPDQIWEVAEGGLTDGEPFFFCFGNPTRTKGKFAETLAAASRWIVRQIDSRTARMTNKKQIAEWLEDHGEDSDFFRVRVRGMMPRAGDMQYIASDIVADAMKRGPGRFIADDPLICSIDLARGGGDDCRIGFRRGKDAKSEKAYRIPAEKSRDSMKVVAMITMVLNRHKPDVTFLDATGLGGPIGDRLRQLGYHVIDVHFGGDADDTKLYSNKTAEMGARLRQWLMDGGSIPDDPQLENELTVREYWHDDKDRLVLERKKDLKIRLKVSPDWADQLYLLFAQDVAPLVAGRGLMDASPQAREYLASGSHDYDPLEIM